MWPYFAIAVATSVIVWAGTLLERRVPEKYRKLVIAIAYILAGAIFCFFAGARTSSVGIDTELYGLPSFEKALDTSFVDYFMLGAYSSWDPLIKVVFWVSANATHSFFWYLFIAQLLFVVPMLTTIRILLKDAGYMGVFTFSVLLFPMSLNFMRQAVAMGYVFLSYVFIRDRKPLLFSLCIVVAALFHSTSLIALLLYPIYHIGASDKGSLALKTAIVAAAVGVAIFALPAVLDLATINSGRYASYINRALEAGNRPIEPFEVGPLKIGAGSVLLSTCLGLPYLYLRKKSGIMAERSPELSGLALVIFFGVAVTFAGVISSPLFRLGLYFAMFAVLLIPLAICRVTNRTVRLAFITITIILLCGYSFGYYVLGNNINGVYPYLMA